MTDDAAETGPRWRIAPYSVVVDVVATANDADELHAEYQSKGAKLVRDLCDQHYGCRDFDVEDCNGYRLCFGHHLD